MVEFMKDLAVSGALAMIFFLCVAVIGVVIKGLIDFWKD